MAIPYQSGQDKVCRYLNLGICFAMSYKKPRASCKKPRALSDIVFLVFLLMSKSDKSQKSLEENELFFDQLKDQFVFFYAATLTAMELVKQLRTKHQNKAEQQDK